MSGVNFNDTDDTVIPRRRLANASMRRLIGDGSVSQNVGTSYERADFLTSTYTSDSNILDPDLTNQEVMIKSKHENSDVYEISATVCVNANNNRTIYLKLIHSDDGVEGVVAET
ncbi:unnamed protein product, partial [marine sediment metagenome]